MDMSRSRKKAKKRRRLTSTTTIRISKDLYTFLKTMYEDPLNDTMDIVIKRMLPSPESSDTIHYAVGNIMLDDRDSALALADIKGEKICIMKELSS